MSDELRKAAQAVLAARDTHSWSHQLHNAIEELRAALAAAQPPAAQADSIVEAWLLGRAVQYLVLGGHDDEWTDFSGGGKPNTGSKRLAWRLKPTPQAQSVPATGAQPLTEDQSAAIFKAWRDGPLWLHMTRGTEAAHGIGTAPTGSAG